MSKSQIVTVDSRGRVSLGSLGLANGTYLVRKEAGGVIILEPAIVTTVEEARARGIDPEAFRQG